MKKSRLIVACVIGLVAAPAAFAAYVEGTANIEELRMQASTGEGTMQTAVRGGAEESIYDLLAAQQSRLATERKGVAGRSGSEMGAWTPKTDSGSGEGNLFDQLRSEFH